MYGEGHRRLVKMQAVVACRDVLARMAGVRWDEEIQLRAADWCSWRGCGWIWLNRCNLRL